MAWGSPDFTGERPRISDLISQSYKESFGHADHQCYPFKLKFLFDL